MLQDILKKPANLGRQETTGEEAVRKEVAKQAKFFPRGYLSHMVKAMNSPDAKHMKLIVEAGGGYREVRMIDTRTNELVDARDDTGMAP